MDGLKWTGVALLFIPYAASLVPSWMRWLERDYYFITDELGLVPPRPRRWRGLLLMLSLMIAPLFLVISATNTEVNRFQRFLQILGYVIVCTSCAMFRPPARAPFDRADVFLLLLIVAPIEAHQYFGDFIYDVEVPTVQFSPDISMLQITAVNMLLLNFLVLRPLRDLGMRLVPYIRWADLVRSVIALALFCVVMVPATLGRDELHDPPSDLNAGRGIAAFVLIYVLYALPREIFFRGILQNMLHSAGDVMVRCLLCRRCCCL